MGKASHGINPVTFRGTDPNSKTPMGLTLGRLHYGIGGIQNKVVTVVVFKDTAGGGDFPDRQEAEHAILGFITLDEDHFVRGLYHLFPTGEMDHAEDSSEPTNAELVSALKDAVAALRKSGGDSDIVGRLEAMLTRLVG